jgi:glycosyltransferase involved in cell wall biosynthesis
MTTIAILGTGPLPIEKDNYIYSSSNRTWQIAKGLLDRGHRVHLIAFRPTRVRDGERVVDPEHRKYQEGLFSLDSVEEVLHFRNDAFLSARLAEVKPDALIGVNAFPAARVAALKPSVPFWADMNGFNMGEVQIRAHLTNSDGAIGYGWNDELPALVAADVFSAASGPQRYALIGELAAIGRLRASTCGHEFVHVIPNGREDPPASLVQPPLRPSLGEEAFLALWVGCYNFQFDTDNLFEGLEKAMAANPLIHFVSTGGKVDGHNETSFAEFERKAAKSVYRERFHFVGWLDWEEFDALMRASDVGVSMDVPCYETEIGARNRLTEMLRVGLPALTTTGPEIAEEIFRHEAGWRIPPRSPQDLASALLDAAASNTERQRRGKNARSLFLEKYTIEASTAPLLAWAEKPWRAPDAGQAPLLMPSPPPAPERTTRLARLAAKILGS